MRKTILLLVFIAFGCAPHGETPGVRLGGTAVAPPESFAFLQETEVIQLEVLGAFLPRVVNVWGVGFDDAAYVWSDPGSGWSQRIAKRPDEVRLRVGDKVYKVRASRVLDADETARVAHAYQNKYAEQMVEIYGEISTVDEFELLYRLTPRN